MSLIGKQLVIQNFHSCVQMEMKENGNETAVLTLYIKHSP